MIGFVLALGLAMVVAPFMMLGPVEPLAGVAVVAAYFSAIRKKISGWGPFIAIHVIGFICFTVKSIQSLGRMWP